MLPAICPNLLGPRDIANRPQDSLFTGVCVLFLSLRCIRSLCRAGPGLVCSAGSPVHLALCACPLLLGPNTDSLSWLRFQIFGIFLAKTLISDIEAVKAGHHF